MVLGLTTAVTLLMPSLALVAAITIIGIPIALFMAAAPGLFLFALMVLAIRRPMIGHWYATYAAGCAALFILGVIPQIFNDRLDRQVAELVAGDHAEFQGPLRTKVLAVRSDQQFGGDGRNGPACDDFCQRALLNGQVDRLLYVTTKDIAGPVDPRSEARSFRMERRDECPAVDVKPGFGSIKIDGEAKSFKEKNATELMRLAMAGGNCLIVEKAPLGSADAILSHGRIRTGQTNFTAGYKLGADTVRADRLSIHQRDNGAYRETYRWTGVVVEKLAPVLIPTIITGSGFDARTGFLRLTEKTNVAAKYYERPDWSAFVTTTLGMDLALRRETVVEDTRKQITLALDSKAQLNAAQQQLIVDFFVGFQRAGLVLPGDDDLILRLLADHRVALPDHAWAAAKYAKDRGADYYASVAAETFRRLAELDTPEARKDMRTVEPLLRNLATLIENLPADSIRPHQVALERLARDEQFRVPAYTALRQLAIFGADATPTLLYLIDDARRVADAKKKRGSSFDNDWQHPYLAAMGGFCRMGAEGAAMIQPLLERIDSGSVKTQGSYWRQTIATLVALGASTDDIWPHMQSDDKNRMREKLEAEASRTLKRRDCSY